TAAFSASTLANLKHRTTCPYPSVGPASTKIPMRRSELVDSRMGSFNKLLPRFQDRTNFIFDDIANENPESVFLGCEQLWQSALHCRSKFHSRDPLIRYFGPAQVF